MMTQDNEDDLALAQRVVDTYSQYHASFGEQFSDFRLARALLRQREENRDVQRVIRAARCHWREAELCNADDLAHADLGDALLALDGKLPGLDDECLR